MNIPTDLERLRDAAAAEYDDLGIGNAYWGFVRGFDKAVEVLTKDAQALAPFDEKAVVEKYRTLLSDAPGWGELTGYIEGARWQHNKLAERVRVAEAERDAYAKAMAVALREGIFANKEEVKRLLSKALSGGG